MVAKLVAFIAINMQTYGGIIRLVCTIALITFAFRFVGCYTAWHVGCIGYLLSKYCLIFICILGAISFARLANSDMHRQNLQIQANIKSEFTTMIGNESVIADMKGYSAETLLDVNEVRTTLEDILNNEQGDR